MMMIKSIFLSKYSISLILLLTLVNTRPVGNTLWHWRAAHRRLGHKVGVFVPFQTERVDHIQAEVGRALDRVAQQFSVSVTHAETVATVVELGANRVVSALVVAGGGRAGGRYLFHRLMFMSHGERGEV